MFILIIVDNNKCTRAPDDPRDNHWANLPATADSNARHLDYGKVAASTPLRSKYQ